MIAINSSTKLKTSMLSISVARIGLYVITSKTNPLYLFSLEINYKMNLNEFEIVFLKKTRS